MTSRSFLEVEPSLASSLSGPVGRYKPMSDWYARSSKRSLAIAASRMLSASLARPARARISAAAIRSPASSASVETSSAFAVSMTKASSPASSREPQRTAKGRSLPDLS